LTIGQTNLDAPFASREEFEARLASEYGAHLAILDQRLDEALRATGFDGAVIFAGDERMIFRDDQAYPFRVEPYFKAWVPLTQAPGSFLRLVPGQRPMLVYKQVDDYWHEPPSDPEGYWTQHFDIRVAKSDAEARKLSGSGARWVAVGSGAERAVQRGGHTALPAINDSRFLNHLDFTRAVKTTYERLCMRGAQAAAVRGHLAVAAAFKPGVSELELHNAYLVASGQRETELPYANIIALNEHAATLHFTRLRGEAPPVTS
jgi:Xaa-Pro dipeptidase